MNHLKTQKKMLHWLDLTKNKIVSIWFEVFLNRGQFYLQADITLQIKKQKKLNRKQRHHLMKLNVYLIGPQGK